ncbi:MAG: ParB/RepB/Spo0J family partition protein [Bacteroidales bacterium]|nr:ParB/RepB/Spo0J family partition protein [Bacteroidales bacterium]
MTNAEEVLSSTAPRSGREGGDPAPSDRKASGPMTVTEIPLSQISPNPFQPRLTFDAEAISELAESIRNMGIIQPLTLRRMPNGQYQIISGERRFRAARIAGLGSVPAYIRQADDTAMLEMAIVENIQRADLDPIETAMSFQRLLTECNLTQELLADRVGKKRASVTNYLRLLRLPAEVQKAVKDGTLSMGHAKVLLSVDNPKLQVALCHNTIDQGWSVRTLEEKVRQASLPEIPRQAAEIQQLPDEYYRVLEVVGRYFNNNISLKRTPAGSGTMTIRFKSDSEIEAFLGALEAGKI